jgi:glycosyltransferase involved in cell wall biosynthesis
VDSELFNPHHFSREARLRLSGGCAAAPLLLYVGRLSPEKRIHWLRAVFDKIPNVRLAIVGDGPARPSLERLFAGTPTTFTGTLRGKALAQAYASADIFTFPAANETLGNVVLEAMASGLPVVAPKSGGVLDHVVQGETGLLAEPESQSDFVEAVERLATHRQYARQLGKAGLQRVAARSWESVLEGLFDDYVTLVNRPRPVPALSALKPQTWTLPE